MNEIIEFTKVIEILNRLYSNNDEYQKELTRFKGQLPSILGTSMRSKLKVLDVFIQTFSVFANSILGESISDFQERILSLYGLNNLLGRNYDKYVERMKEAVKLNSKTSNQIIRSFENELELLSSKPAKLLKELEPFTVLSSQNKIENGEVYIDLIFKEGVEIDNFVDAKTFISDWRIILRGYATLLNCNEEEFQIHSITKSSPTRIKIKMSYEKAALIISVLSLVLDMQEGILNTKSILSLIRSNETIQSTEVYDKLIEEVNEKVEFQIEEEVEKIVTRTLKEHGISESEGDIKNGLKVTIEKEYYFISNGGDINIHLDNSESELFEQVKKIEHKQNALKEKLIDYRNQKQLEEFSKSKDENVPEDTNKNISFNKEAIKPEENVIDDEDAI